MIAEYEYNNKKYESAVRDLKSTFFDIVSLHQNNLRGLRNNIDNTVGEEQIALVKKYNQQKFQLNEMLGLVDGIIEVVQAMDSCNHYLDNRNTIEQGLDDNFVKDDSNLNRVEQPAESFESSIPQHIDEKSSLSDVNNNDETIEMNNFEPDNIMLDGNIDEIDGDSENKVEMVPTGVPMDIAVGEQKAPVIDQTNTKLAFPEPNMPTIVGNDENKEKVIPLEQESNDIGDADNTISDNNISPVLTVNENTNNEVVAEVPNENTVITGGNDVNEVNDAVSSVPQEVNLSQILSPIDDVLPVNADEVSTINDVAEENKKLESNENESEAVEDVVSNVSVDSSKNIGLHQRFIRVSGEQVKAILVTDKQYSNLVTSRGNQKILFEGFASSGVSEQGSFVDEEVDQGIVQQQENIEKMLEQANSLYKEGKVAEAQKMYDEVSAMNKQLQSRTKEQVGVSLVKK